MLTVTNRPPPAKEFASIAAMDAGLPLADGRLITIPGLPTLAYCAALAGDRKVIPAHLHPNNGIYELISSWSFHDVFYHLALTNFVADTSQHGVVVNSVTYGGTVTGATQQAVLASLKALIDAGEGITTTVTGTGAAARLVFPVDQEVDVSTNVDPLLQYPAGFAEARAETGRARYDAVNGVELHATDGATAVTAASYARLAHTGFATPAGDTDRTVIIAQHAWAADGSLAANDTNRLGLSLRLALNNLMRLYAASSPEGGADGYAQFLTSTGAVTTPRTQSQPRTEVWDLISVPKVTTVSGLWAQRLDTNRVRAAVGPAAGVEANNFTYRAENANPASTTDPQIHIRAYHLLQMGV